MGLAPEIFWNMSLVEWRAALTGFGEARGVRAHLPAGSLGRRELDALMQTFPDEAPNA